MTPYPLARLSVAGEQPDDLHRLRQLDQKLRIAVEVVDVGGIAPGEARHRRDVLPVGDGHELALVLAILAECLYAERLLDQRHDADVVVVLLVFVGALAAHAAAPDAGDGRPLGIVHFGPHSWTTVSLTGSSMRVSFNTSPCCFNGSSAATPLPTPGKTGRPRGTLASARDRKKAS